MARTFSDLVKGVEAKEKAQAEAARVAQPAAPVAAPAVPAIVAATPTTPAKPKKESAAPSVPKVTEPKGQVKVKPEDQLAAAPAQATIVVPDEVKREIDYRTFYDASRDPTVTMAVRTAAANMGLTPADFRKAAQAQGVSLESIHAARMKGRTYEQVAQANRERGVLGFMPVPEREATFKSTVERAESAARGEAPTSIKLKESGADKGLLGGYIAAGTREVLPEVTRPGEYGYLTSQLLVDAIKKDPEASSIYDLYGRKLGVGNTQKAVEARVKQLSQRAGISAADPESDTKMRALRKRAINEIIAWKTVGQWTPAITMQDVQATEGEEAPGIFAALGPNVEIIGFNNDGQAITRQESPLSVLFRAIDLPQEMTVGALEKGGTAAQGVQTNANFLEFALDHTEDSTPLVRYPAVAAGLAASIIFPDALLAAGAVGKVGKAAKQIYNVRKIAPEATALLETIAKARSTRSFDKAKEAEIALRAKFPAVADEFDRYDASAAQFISMKRPESASFDEDLSALIASRIPAASEEVAAGRVHLHPSVRKDVLGVKTPTKDTPLASYFELFNTPALKDRVARAKAAFLAAAPSTKEAYLADFARGTVRDALAAPLAAGKVTAAQVDEIADLVAARAPLMMTDEDTWRTAVRDALKVHPEFGKPEFSNVRKSVYVPGRNSVRTRLARKATEIAGMDIADLTAADVALFDRAMQAIDDNNEARGLAASLLRDRVAADARIRVTPLDLFDDVAPTLPGGEPIRLSPGGLLLLKQVRKAMPDADLKELYASVSVIDRMIVGAARKREVDPFTLYGETFPEIRRATADDVARLGGRAGGAPPTTPATPAAATVAATAAVPASVTAAAAAAPVASRMGTTLVPALESLRGRTALERAVAAVEMMRDETDRSEALRLVGLTDEEYDRLAAPATRIADRGARVELERWRDSLTEEATETLRAPRAAAEPAGSDMAEILARRPAAGPEEPTFSWYESTRELAPEVTEARVTEATSPRILERTESLYEPTVSEPTLTVTRATEEVLEPTQRVVRPIEEAPVAEKVAEEVVPAAKVAEAAVKKATPAASAAKRIILPADLTWLAYFRKVLPAQKPGDALRAAVKRVEALYEDEDFARSLATRQATNRILGVDPEAVLSAPETERNAMLEALDVDGGVSESDLLDYTPIHQMLDLTPAKALEMGKFPAGTKAAQVTPEILENLAERIVEIAGETGDFAEVTGAMRAMGGAAEESLADVRYAAQELQSRIVPMDKEAAFAFVRKHHSKLPDARPAGLLAAVGLAGAGETRVVGLLNTPSGPFAKDKVFGVVELSRVASDGTLKGGASAITLWAMENLQKFNRTGDPSKARLVTTALLSEPGEVYKVLEADGLRPTSMVTPSKPSGARAGAVGTARKGEWKINYEFGPAALPAQPHLYDLPPVFRDVVTNKEKLSIKRLNSLVRRPGVDTVQAYKDAARVLGVDAKTPEMMAARLASRANEAGRQKIADDLRYMLLERFNSKQIADMDVKEQSALRSAAAPTPTAAKVVEEAAVAAPAPAPRVVKAAAPKAAAKPAPKISAADLSRKDAMARVSAAQTEAEKAKEAYLTMQERRVAGSAADPSEADLRKLFDNAVARAEGYRRMAGFGAGINPLDEIVSGTASARKLDELEAEAAQLRTTILSNATPAAPATPSGITPPVSAPVVAEKISQDLEKSLAAVKKLRSPKATEKFLKEFEASTLTPAEKVKVYDSLATKLEKLAEAEGGDLKLETLADMARTAEFRNRQAAETLLREGGQALRQVSPTGATKGAVDLLADGRQVIILFEGADVSTVLHEAAHIIRRNILSTEDMSAITAWVTSRGVRVGHEFGEFTGDAAEIEKAEELFAQAFERYVMEGQAPTPSLTNVFDILKQALLDIYRGVRDPVLGVNLKPEVRAVFDGLLADVPEQASPTLKQVLRREMLGTDEEEVTGPLGILAREATRKGMPRTSEEDLIRQFESAQSRNVPQDQVYVSFPAPVMGKRDWTFNELAELQATREESRRVARARERGIRLDLTGRGYGEAAQITEDSAVETLRGALAAVEGETGAKAVVRGALRTVAATFFGGDVMKEKGMRLLPPELRRALDTSERVVEQGVGDTVSLLNDALRTKKDRALFRYLGGGTEVRRVDGRPILSAGYDYMGAVKNMFVRSIGTLDTDEVDALRQLADAVNSSDPGKALATLGFNRDGTTFRAADAARQKTQALAVKAINKILYLQGKAAESDFGSALASALRGAVDASPVPRPTHEMRLVEAITYISGVTARDGKMFVGDSATMARTFAGDVRSIYNEESARRVLVLVGGFGSADKAKLQLVKLNLGVTEDTKRAFSNWLVGESWDPAQSENIQRLVDRYGMNPEFVKDTVLDTTFYVPRLARERMAKALARATYRPDVAATGADTFNAVYRYMKTRMTRGSFFIRQRYYMMNTVDHFIQLGMTAGFGVAASSVTRVIAQDLMVLPGWQQVVELARKLPGGQRIPEDALEIVRRGLQRGGDVVGQRIGQMFGAGKYRIEVNPILEGLDGGFRAGNKVYSYREIRNIAVEEGVFASFDTRELADAIQREGELSIRGRGALTGGSALSTSSGSGKINDFFADWQKTVSNTAEAWGERERLGAMVALMEAGHDPRTAARLTIDALYDYSQSMTKADRSLLVGVLFPFWAFQKNANAQVFNLMFSPWGAYRMMCIRRARERGAELLAEVLYNDVGGDYGVDVKRMPPELQDSFYSIVTAVENEYNGEIPENVKRAMRLLFTGRGRDIMDGRLVEASAEIQRLREVGAFAEMQKFAEYAALPPDISGRGSYNRDRIGVPVMFPRTAPVRQYYRMVGDQHSYLEAYLPESSIEAGFKHHTQFLAAYVLMGAAPYDFLTGNLTEQGYKEVTVKNVLAPVADPERSPILGPLLADVSPDLVPPTRLSYAYTAPTQAMAKVHPGIGKQMDDLFGTTFLRVGALNDPFVGGAREGDMKELSEESIREIKMLQEQYPDTAILRDQRYYLPGGVWSTLFQNSPLGEFNNLAIRYEENPEERPDIRGEMLRWARGVLGLDVAFVSPKKTAQREEPKKLKETKNP